ncbi:MAG: phospholipid carrier-dependent glycosyltransferase [Clostridiales bacterium]|nr:phospholipid carrier-dependent glycosyltransferase [Clostridiales bacterium]
MKKKTKWSIMAAALALVLAACAVVFLAQREREQPVKPGNLLENGDFSAVTDGMPDHWNTGMWVTSAGASYLEAATAADGTTAALVENVAANDARFEQTVSVRGNATYRLTARVMAEGCDTEELGANVSFLGVYGTSEDVHDTDGAWQTLTLYAHTGKGQKEATVCVRLGGYGSEATGRALFTDVCLEQVEEAPVGAFVLDLSTPEPQKEPAQKGGKGAVIPGLLAAAAAYLIAAFVVARMLLAGGRMDGRRGFAALAGLLLAALLLRVALSACVAGYGVDMGCFGAWASRMAAVGPANFYEEGYFCDYPPAYMLVLGALGGLANLFGLSFGTMGGEMLLKTVPIFCDILLALAVFLVTDRAVGRRPALGMAALMALNPAYIITGACWGQIDSVLAVLLVALLLLARRGKWQAAIPMFALAVLAKPQAGLLVPLGVAALLRDAVKEKETRKPIALGLLGGVLVTAVIVLPFSANQSSPLWIVDKYVETLSSYAYATLSTGNLMFLLGGNWTPNDQAVLGPITYGQLGMALMVLSFAFGIVVYLRGTGRKRLLLASAATMQLVFVLGSKMHERYILPALALLLLAFVETGDVRLLASAVLAGAAAAVNIGAVLAFEHLIAPNLWLGYVIGALQLLAAGLTVWAAVCLSLGRAPMRQPARRARPVSDAHGEAAGGGEGLPSAAEMRMREELLHAKDYRLHLTKKDALIMLVLTLVYGVVGFWGLGATKAPQDGYTSTAAGETVVIDLGARYEDFHIYYYGGVSSTAFSVATSDDGVTYTEETGAYFDIGECYKWLAMRQPVYDADGSVSSVTGGMLSFSGRYIRLTFDGAASSLWEVAAVDGSGEVIPPVGASSAGGVEGRMSDPNSLIDEQDTVPDKPSYYNSMYFDEIYHARTGYEHAHGQYTYETTHPPLGKVFMSWCIRLMGMTPFAWRFAGALCGVLMVPAIYLLAKTLLGSTLWAGLCALLLSADCMHFTQTRIATIDSFPVLFMMLMFLFMARWMKMSYYHQRLRDTFVPLALSGAFMGLAIASKWIGCYGAVGLAVLFFSRFIGLWRQGLYAERHRDEDPAFVRAADTFRDKGIKTILACFVFFVFVPVVIYVLSYIPYLRAYGEIKWNLTTFARIWDAQVLMFDYHKNLVAEHYFASPWYEWPLIVKPMWYYNADFKGAGMASSILSFGNPAVWWTGLAGILFVLCYSVYRNALPALRVLPSREDEDDRAMPVIAVGFLSAYLPWVLVSRLTFIYHYFASVPWIIIATALGLKYLARHHRRLAYALAAVLSIAAIALFIGFYPLASGVEVPRAWCDAMNWFKGWMWY